MLSRIGDTERNRIVVGIDGSLHSVDVLREGVRVTRAMECCLEAVAVWQPQQILMDEGEIERNPEVESWQALFDISKFVFGDEHPDWYSTFSLSGDPAQVLIEFSATAQMLIVGSRGHCELVALAMGSVSRACIHRASCPVLIMRSSRAPLRPGSRSAAASASPHDQTLNQGEHRRDGSKL